MVSDLGHLVFSYDDYFGYLPSKTGFASEGSYAKICTHRISDCGFHLMAFNLRYTCEKHFFGIYF